MEFLVCLSYLGDFSSEAFSSRPTLAVADVLLPLTHVVGLVVVVVVDADDDFVLCGKMDYRLIWDQTRVEEY